MKPSEFYRCNECTIEFDDTQLSNITTYPFGPRCPIGMACCPECGSTDYAVEEEA